MKKIKKVFQAWIIALFTLFIAPINAQVKSIDHPSTSRPNIVILLADDLGYGDVKWNNTNSYIETPNLDKLAREGAVLTDFYSASSMCSPSRAGLLTGRIPTRTGVHDWIKEDYKKPYSDIHLPTEEVTIAELLKKAGYQTAVIGKWHLNNGFRSGNNSDPDDQGFDYWFCTPVQSEPSHRNPNNYFDNGKPAGQIGTETNPEFSSGIVAGKAIQWLKKRRIDHPFFLYLAFHEPHVICDAPDEIKKKYLKKIRDGEIPLLEGTGKDGLGQAEYYGCVENMDRAIGQILKALKEEQILDNTIILFTSDNGPDTNRKFQGRLQSVGETGIFRGRKRWLLEGGIRQASILFWKGIIKPATTITREMGQIDLLPTICDITGIPLPANRTIDGISILPVLQGKSIDRSLKPLHWHFYSPRGNSPRSVMREGKWIITADWDQPRPQGRFDTSYVNIIKHTNLTDLKLYNIAKDPGQLQDIKSKYTEVYNRLCAKIKELHKNVTTECPSSMEYQYTKPEERKPFYNETIVFEPMTDGMGYHNYRIPSIISTRNGVVLAVAEGRVGKNSDHAENDLVLRRSTNGGRSWEPPRVIAADGDRCCMNPVLVQANNGDVLLVYIKFPADCHTRELESGKIRMCEPGYKGKKVERVYLIRSYDDGITWTKPEDITRVAKFSENTVAAISGPGTGIILQKGAYKGRVIIPMSDLTVKNGERVYNEYVLFSDDNGKNWKVGEIAPNNENTYGNELQMVELEDGSVMMNCRVSPRNSMRKVAISNDGGQTWSNLRNEPRLKDSGCMASILRYRFKEGNKPGILIYSGSTERTKNHHRGKGTFYLSYDDGRNWPVSRLFHPESFDYSCLTILPDGSIGLLGEFDFDGQRVQIRLAKFNLNHITN